MVVEGERMRGQGHTLINELPAISAAAGNTRTARLDTVLDLCLGASNG